MVSRNDFKAFCLKWDLLLKFKLYKVTASAGLPLAEPCQWRKFGSVTADVVVVKAQGASPKRSVGLCMKDFRAVLGRMSPQHREGLARGHIGLPSLQ